MEARAELQALIDRMSEDKVLDLIDFINNTNAPDELTPEEMAELGAIEKDMAAGDYITYEECKEKYGVGILQSSGSDADSGQG